MAGCTQHLASNGNGRAKSADISKTKLEDRSNHAGAFNLSRIAAASIMMIS